MISKYCFHIKKSIEIMSMILRVFNKLNIMVGVIFRKFSFWLEVEIQWGWFIYHNNSCEDDSCITVTWEIH